MNTFGFHKKWVTRWTCDQNSCKTSWTFFPGVSYDCYTPANFKMIISGHHYFVVFSFPYFHLLILHF